MHIATGRFQTEKGSKDLQQLCKHFAHKIDVNFTPEHGAAVLPVGLATLCASPDALTVGIALSDLNALDRAHHIIDSHLERFAFREDFKAMDWSISQGEQT